MPTLRCRLLNPLSPTTVEWLDDARVELGEDGRIAAVGPWAGGRCDEDLRPGVLTPGFVDGHVHFPQLRIIGAASGPLLTWLQRSTFPEEARMADPAHAASVAHAFVACLAAAGSTTSFIYSSAHPAACDALLDAVDRRGLRAIAGPVLMDRDAPEELLLPASEALPALEALVDRWHGHDGRIQVAVVPRFALSCTMDLMTAAGELARRRHLPVSTHLSENPAEVQATTALHRADDYLAVYEQAGLVHDRTVFAHCIHLSESEWDRLAAAGAVVAHCPDSNDFLGSGGMPLGAVDARGIPLT
ncbi:MAG: guanine deaminase, partial [Deltaproteobacteria bacterium]